MSNAGNDGGVVDSDGWRLFKIIVIEDDEGLNHLIQKRLKREGFQTGFALSGKEAIDKITGAGNELLLIDYKLPDMNGMQLAERLKQKLPQIPDFIVMTGYGDERIAVDMMKLGAREYLIKEADFTTILPEKVKRICVDIEKHRKLAETEEELERSRELLTEIGRMAQIGAWELDLFSNRVSWTEITKEIHEVPKDFTPILEEALDFYPKESRSIVEKAIRDAIDKGIDFDLEIPLITAKGRQIWTHSIGKPLMKDGKCVRLRGTFQDITARKIAEEEIKKSESRLKRTEELAKIGSWDWDVATDTVTWSDELFRIFQLDPKDGAPSFAEHSKMYSEESLKLLTRAVEKAVAEGISYHLDLILIRSSGESLNCAVKGYAKKDISGKVIGLYGSFQDITERKEHEKKLVKLNGQLSLAQNIAKLGYWSFDVKSQIPSWTDEVFEMYAVPKENGEPNYFEQKKFVHPDDWAYFDNAVQKLIEEEVPYDIQIRLVHRDNKIVWIRIKGFCRKDERGEVNELYGVVQDITDYKKVEKQLVDQKLLFETMFNAIEDGIIVSDTSRKIILANKGIKTTFGYSPEEIIGKTTKILYADEQKYKEAGTMVFGKNAKSQDQFFVTDFKDKNNLVFPGETFGRKLFNTEGEWIGNLGMMRNVTERLAVVEELRRAKEKAEESDRLKSAFLANMSHEIRTPMNGILGFTSLLQDPELSGEDQKQFLDIIMQSGNRLLETVNDLMDIAKIETGLMDVSLEEMNVKKEINQLYDFFTEEANRKGLKLMCTCLLSSDEEIIETDIKKFISITTNLIKNAIKYTKAGSIEIKIEKKDGKLICQVIDTGIGIPCEKQQAIFERFIQGDIATKRAYEGSGLGLAIAKAYVQMLNGEIGVKSEEDKGSTFYFSIPLKNSKIKDNQTKDNTLAAMSGTDNKNLKILIAEDDLASYQYLSILLKSFSTEIIHATTGVQTIELVNNNPDIDLIMMDIQMPEKNGYEATKEIREFNKDVVIVAQTAFAMEGDREKALAAGCNDYISKPIKRDVLVDLIHQLF
ncbi:response regulator [Sunxiuqinia indica]|uniref:response regulator n=1 Tax=Sunxiuqinia indica TaxID=2692584 RepID=UPI00135C377F|nr:response regulator [Sunxiuqinia indica]